MTNLNNTKAQLEKDVFEFDFRNNSKNIEYKLARLNREIAEQEQRDIAIAAKNKDKSNLIFKTLFVLAGLLCVGGYFFDAGIAHQKQVQIEQVQVKAQ